MAQPQTIFSGKWLHIKIYEQAAAYLYHLAMNHLFLDDNKRTAFAVMDTFLKLDSYRLNLTNEEAYKLVLPIVESKITKKDLNQHLENVVENN